MDDDDVFFFFCTSDVVGDWRQWCRSDPLPEPNGVGLGHRDGARGFHADTPQTAERPSGQSGRTSSCSAQRFYDDDDDDVASSEAVTGGDARYLFCASSICC